MDITEQFVNRATWSQPEGVEPGWAIVNAPRPLPGRMTWDGPFRCGIFYAAGPPDDFDSLGESWRQLDARRIALVDNADVERMARAYLIENGYETPEQLGLTIGEVAGYMDPPLPWHE